MGSKSKSKSYNLNNELIKNTYGSSMDSTGTATSAMTALLGFKDSAAQDEAFKKFREGSGYDFTMSEALRGVNAGAAGGGTYGSGARYKALQDRAGDVANQSFKDYVQQILALGQMGLGAGGLVTSAGQFNKSKSKGGLGETLGSIGSAASGIAAISDIRVKDNIEKIGELADGLGVYAYNYIWDDPSERQIGVMAQEVAELRPWALGPTTEDGYMSVNYERLDDNG